VFRVLGQVTTPFRCGGVAAAAEGSMTTWIRRRQISAEICRKRGGTNFPYTLPVTGTSSWRYLCPPIGEQA